VVVGSTRPGRAALPLAEWIAQIARDHGGFEVELVDLADVDLPLFNEPRHPILKQYEYDYTKRWSAIVDAADAFVMVSPEYNHGITAVLKNAIDYLHSEWAYKAVGILSYGGVAAGTRSAAMLKQVLAPLKMVPTVASVSLPFFQQFIVDGVVKPNTEMTTAANAMLDELAHWTKALKTLRAADA
jgi:NAD(P)H-dependent FMN reductase